MPERGERPSPEGLEAKYSLHDEGGSLEDAEKQGWQESLMWLTQHAESIVNEQMDKTRHGDDERQEELTKLLDEVLELQESIKNLE